MNLIIKFFCFLLVLGLAGLFVLKKPDGSPWLSIDEFIPNTQALMANTLSLANKTKRMVEKKVVNATDDNNDNIYRWKDDNGQWQFSDTPPTNQTVESIHVSGNLNSDLVEKFTPPQEETLNTATKAEETSSITPTTISPEKISTLMRDAKNIQQLMDDRTSQLNKQLP